MFGITLTKVIEGLLMFGIIHACIWVLTKLMHRSERKLAIWLHYQDKARGYGHRPKSVLECNDERCVIL